LFSKSGLKGKNFFGGLYSDKKVKPPPAPPKATETEGNILQLKDFAKRPLKSIGVEDMTVKF
jgi:hypothetical protein